jgi:hypothetical protein
MSQMHRLKANGSSPASDWCAAKGFGHAQCALAEKDRVDTAGKERKALGDARVYRLGRGGEVTERKSRG